MNILYIHGLGSSANTSTVKHLAILHPQHQWFAVDVYPNLTKSLKIIEDFIRDNSIDILIGTSMGGFQTLATHFDGYKIAINPPLYSDFKSLIGTNIKYFIPRTDKNEVTFDFTEDDVDEMSRFDLSETITPKTFIVCSEEDELLGNMYPYAETLMSPYDGNKHVIRTNSMGHRISQNFIEHEFGNILQSIICE